MWKDGAFRVEARPRATATVEAPKEESRKVFASFVKTLKRPHLADRFETKR